MREELTEIAIDLSEVALDALTENEFIKEIPVIGTLVRMAKATKSIPDLIFAKKVEKFVSGSVSTKITDEKRQEFYKLLQSKPELRQQAGECIMLTLDRTDDLRKAAIIGKLFSHFVKKDFSFDIFRRLLAAVDRAFLDDLLSFPKWALRGSYTRGFDPRSLEGTGLVSPVYPTIGDTTINSNTEPQYYRSDLGKIYAGHLFDFNP